MALGTYLLRNEKNESNEKNEQIVKNNSFNYSFIQSFISSFTHYLALATCIAIILVLPATMIRASWLGALAGSIVVIWYAVKQQITQVPIWFRNLFASKTKKSLIIFSIIAISTVSSVFLYKIKEGSSIGKSFIWEVTLGKIAEKPLIGHSLGRFEAEYNNWQAQYFQNNPAEMDGPKGLSAGNTKYCFNEYLEMASEVGLVGLILFVGLMVSLILKRHSVVNNGHSVVIGGHSVENDSHAVVIDGHSVEEDGHSVVMHSHTIVAEDNSLTINDAKQIIMNDKIFIINDAKQMTIYDQNSTINDAKQMTMNDNYITNLIFLPPLITILVCAAISYPFYNAPVLILIFVVMGMVSALIGRRSSRPTLIENWFFKPSISRFTKPASIALKYSTILLLIVSSITITYNQYHKYIAYQNWQTANYTYQVGDFTGANELYQANFEQLKYEGIFLQQYGKNLQMADNNKKAIKILEQACKHTSDYVLYCTLGDAYNADKEYAKAENAYLFASRMLPHLLYPQYLLAKLYSVSNQCDKAIAKANEVLIKSAKTESMAVKEIKDEMKKLINEKQKLK